MICTVHQNPADDLLYAGLQLQCLHAHWKKVDAFRRNNPGREGTLREFRKDKDSKASSDRDIKLSHQACRAVRAMQLDRRRNLLISIAPLQTPGQFLDILQTPPPGDESRRLCIKLRRYCEAGYEPGSGGGGGERIRGGEPSLFLVDYLGRSYGLTSPGAGSGFDPEDDDGADGRKPVNLETVVRPHVVGADGATLTNREIVQLGLDPLEMAGGADILTSLGAGQDRHEARESAHAQARSFEIDRRLFPWNSEAVRLEEFHGQIRPLLEQVRHNRSAKDLDIFAAAVVGALIETGRTVDDLRDLRIETQLSSSFAYRPPDGGRRCGTWLWDAITARYEADLRGDQKEIDKIRQLQVEPAEFLTYPASEIVTDLLEKWIALQPARKDNRLFPFRRGSISAHLRSWLEINGVEYRRFTPGRLRNLIWSVLHQITGGELASACLVLGLAQPMAQVELFYALLHEEEAASLFAGAKTALWVNDTGQAPAAQQITPDPPIGKFTGCRAFPRITEVQRITKQFREASVRFFNMRPSSFKSNNKAHREMFNNAVMYGVWHQAFSFGARAITDAYQKRETLNAKGFGLLDDKGFAEGYRTRIVYAGEHLRIHMRSLEIKLAALGDRVSGEKPGPVWLLDEAGLPVEVRPATIHQFLKDDFPFPVNVPRKVMRYLLRKSGMSHTNAEAYMGHWWHGREPFSPSSSFDFGVFLEDLSSRLPNILEKQLGFWPVPGYALDGR
jgi:hypothetical protein